MKAKNVKEYQTVGGKENPLSRQTHQVRAAFIKRTFRFKEILKWKTKKQRRKEMKKKLSKHTHKASIHKSNRKVNIERERNWNARHTESIGSLSHESCPYNGHWWFKLSWLSPMCTFSFLTMATRKAKQCTFIVIIIHNFHYCVLPSWFYRRGKTLLAILPFAKQSLSYFKHNFSSYFFVLMQLLLGTTLTNFI